jgi:regulator of protease activity HflC (stomatin/prohibitin superfamily)
MTAHDPAFQWPEQAPASHCVAAAGLVRPLAWLAALTIAAAAAVFVLSRPAGAHLVLTFHLFGLRLPALDLPTIQFPGSGLTVGSLLVAGYGIVACLCMVLARRRAMTPDRVASGRLSVRPTRLWPQTVIALLFLVAAGYAVVADWPLHRAVATQDAAALGTAADIMAGGSGFTVASILLLLATPWLLAERYLATVAPERLPETDDLRSLLFLPVFFLAAQALLQVAAALGFATLVWGRVVLSVIVLLISAELVLRVLARWFLPPPDAASARATIGSLLAGALRGRALSPASVAGAVRSQFGMDFSRSWALHFMRATAAPVALAMLAFCWFLTGVSRIDLNQRGTYERFGKVTTILKPGLHLGLPWPFGVVRHVELGVMHAALISYTDQGTASPAADHASAEGEAPASANRLWDKEQPTDVSYIIASSEQDRQSFQTVSASVRVLYRVGLHDADASAALYHEEDPDALVHALAGRLLAQFFAAHTLPSVLGESQNVIAADLRTRLRQALDQLGSGIDVVTVTVEAIHPPAGAASAYRNVQAAEIEATTSIATERGRAQTTQSVAQRDARSATDDATAAAAETVSAAGIDLTDITADDRPYRAAGTPFLLERYFTDLQAALVNVPLEIVDHRLTGASLPTIDLRPPGTVWGGAETRSNRNGTAGDK